MRTLLVCLLVALCGCRPHFDTVEEACHDRVPGQGRATAQAIEVVKRANCYRRVARMARGSVDYRVSAAAASHAQYIQENGIPLETSALREEPGEPGFTGELPPDRVAAQGYDLGDNYDDDIGYWEGVFERADSFNPGSIADGWMESPYSRQAVLQPSWKDAGYGVSTTWAVLTIIFDYPAPEHMFRPVVYPADGQIDVPSEVRWIAVNDGVVPPSARVGYPITVTVGSDDGGSGLEDDNPYELLLLHAEISGPDGLIDHYELVPEGVPFDFPFSVAIIPRDPLEPNTTYTASFEIGWNAQLNKDVVTTFTTAPDSGNAARGDGGSLVHAVFQPPGMDDWAFEYRRPE